MRTHLCGNLNESQADERVSLCGWVHARRDLGGLIFLSLRDHGGIVQVVVELSEQAAIRFPRCAGGSRQCGSSAHHRQFFAE